jgi:hypothetical protein
MNQIKTNHNGITAKTTIPANTRVRQNKSVFSRPRIIDLLCKKLEFT